MSQTQIANATAAITRIHPSQTSDESQITGRCGGDDWHERLTEDEWHRVEAFFRHFEIMWECMDFVAVKSWCPSGKPRG